ncbi:hypothetical protein F5883DRAFT_33081 [Diaporthe sp. PMI_573]|nr:hypothetical protein F5883DRAFT_33081 [Diaporthaceae sp. PMI_573]
MEVVVWGTNTIQGCESVLKCTIARLHIIQNVAKDGSIRNGQFGSNINCKIVAANTNMVPDRSQRAYLIMVNGIFRFSKSRTR